MTNFQQSSSDDFSQKDLSCCDLSYRDFNGSNMVCCKLDGSNLSFAELNGARLQEAQFYGANLSNAKLCGAQLSDAKLNGANLTNVDLTNADLRRADLSNAKLIHTNLDGANVKGAQFEGSIGLTDDTKRDLKNRGALIRKNNTGHEFPDLQWWLQYVVVPLTIAGIGGGGIVSLFHQQPSVKNLLNPAQNSQSTTQNALKPNSRPITK